MKSAYWICNNCSEDYSKHDERLKDYQNTHDSALDKPTCCHCQSQDMTWVYAEPNKGIDEPPYVFDFYHQCYRDKEGKVIRTPSGHVFMGGHACPECNHNAEYVGCTAYYESYKCGFCNHSFEVR